MSDVVNHQANPPGVTWDLTIAGHRYLVIEDVGLTDCETTRSRLTAYQRHKCRCDTCREFWTTYRRGQRAARRVRKEAELLGGPP